MNEDAVVLDLRRSVEAATAKAEYYEANYRALLDSVNHACNYRNLGILKQSKEKWNDVLKGISNV